MRKKSKPRFKHTFAAFGDLRLVKDPVSHHGLRGLFFHFSPLKLKQFSAAYNARQIIEGGFSAETKQELEGGSSNFLNYIIERKLHPSRGIHDETAMDFRYAVAASFHHALNRRKAQPNAEITGCAQPGASDHPIQASFARSQRARRFFYFGI